MSKRAITVVALMVFLFPFASVQVIKAADYPTKPVEILCPYPPGGSVDMLGRLIAELAPKYLGQSMAVISKMGASGSVAAADIITSKPDGYKVVITTPDYFAMTVHTQKIQFDPSLLIPLATFMEQKLGLIVKGDSQFKNLNDVLEYGKKNPDKLRWGHTGRGVTSHLATLMILKKNGVKVLEVPEKGGPEVLAGVLGGHMDLGTVPFGPVKEQVRAGAVRYVVFFAAKPYSDPPGVPASAELGYPETVLPPYFSLFIHKNTLPEIVKKLTDVCEKLQKDPDMAKGIEKIGENPKFAGPQFVRDEIVKQEKIGTPILKDLGLWVEK
jgi:tripartite-type tricarboxylate transporter receptor subunit TctC